MACKFLERNLTFYKGDWNGSWILCITFPTLTVLGTSTSKVHQYDPNVKLPQELIRSDVWISNIPPGWGNPVKITYKEALELLSKV